MNRAGAARSTDHGPVNDAEERSTLNAVSAHRPAAVIVLAAGEGTRMKSATPKVLHELCGRSLIGHAIASARELAPRRLIVVVGHGKDAVRSHVGELDAAAETVVQERQNGTGHAVRMVGEATGMITGTVIVTYGDVPLLSARTLGRLLERHEAGGNAATVLSAVVPDPTGYGRIIRDGETFAGIVEHRDAADAQRAIDEINSGVYAFDGAALCDAIKRVSTDNAKGEEYLTDAVTILRDDGHPVDAVVTDDWTEIQGVNDRVQLAEARAALNRRLLDDWMRAGVTVIDPHTTWVDVGVTLGQDTVLEPNTQLKGTTRIEAGARIGPDCELRDTVVGAGATVTHAVTVQAEIGPEVSVGPYTYLRPGTRLERGAKAGTYVEMKNATIGEGSKVPHLSYVGDAEIGVGTNIGASAVFANYDGVRKHRSTVGDHVHTGSDSTFVAPVNIGDGAYVGAGTVVRRDVPPGALSVSGGPQRVFEGWVANRWPGSAAADAARRGSRLAEQRQQQPQADESKGETGDRTEGDR